jgi:hypothetical protein
MEPLYQPQVEKLDMEGGVTPLVKEPPTHTGFAFSEENNPNPQLFERVRQGTIKHLQEKSHINNIH